MVEAIDGVSMRGWEERKLKALLMGAAYTVVQIHTDKRIVPVQRDCDAEPTLGIRQGMPSVPPPPPQQQLQYLPRPGPPMGMPEQLPPMPRTGREASFREAPSYPPYYRPGPGGPGPGPGPGPGGQPPPNGHYYSSMGTPDADVYRSQDPYMGPGSNKFASQDYGYMAPGHQPQYSTVQAPVW